MQRRQILALGVAGLASLASPSRAQAPNAAGRNAKGKDPGEPEDPAAKPDPHNHVSAEYGPPISIDFARKVLGAAVYEAERLQVSVVVSIVDSGGNLMAFERLDKALLASSSVSQDKARAAVIFRRGTHELHSALRAGNNALLSIDGFVASPGGLPLVIKDKVVGAIGVSGGSVNDKGESLNKVVAEAGVSALKRLVSS